MTDISVTTTDYQVEDRSWLLSQWGQGPGENPSVVLDISTFTKATHYPNGYIPSGVPLAKITASSDANKITVGPYDDAAVDGRATFFGFLFAATKVPDVNDNTKDRRRRGRDGCREAVAAPDRPGRQRPGRRHALPLRGLTGAPDQPDQNRRT